MVCDAVLADKGGLQTKKPTNPLKVDSKWINTVLPFNIAIGPIGTLVQLYILSLGGTVVEVGIAVTLFNAVSIPAAMFWGYITDRFHKRRPLIITSFVATAITLALFVFVDSVYLISILYALISFVTIASTTPLNLLIMETKEKPKWASSFAKLSMMTSIGMSLGLILSMIWATILPLKYLVLPLGVLSLSSAVLASFKIREPLMTFERHVIVLNKPSFIHRLREFPILFLKIPKLYDFRRLIKTLKHDLTKQTPLLYFSIFFFFLSSGLFNTSFVPTLQYKHVPSFLIFLVSGITTTFQIFCFRYAGAYAEKNTPKKAAIRGLLLRSAVFGFMGLSTLLLFDMTFYTAMLILYPLAGGLAYAVYYTSSNIMIFNGLGPKGQGSTLGVFSALSGIALMSGSFISGFTSLFLGYPFTYILSAIFLILSIWLTKSLVKM